MNPDEQKKKLSDEGFKFVFEWHDEPGKTYDLHAHKDKVAFYLTEGSLEFDFQGKRFEVKKGERFDVPPKTLHTGKIGPNGATFIVGEMIEGDA